MYARKASPRSARAPMFQEAVHVDVGQHRAHDAALRRAPFGALAARHPPLARAVPLFGRRCQPQLDQPQHMPVDDAAAHRFEQVRVRDRVEIFRQISVDDVRVAPADQPVRLLDRIDCAATRSIPISAVLEVRLEDRLQHKLGGSLRHAVPDCRDAERPLAASGLRDHHPPHGFGLVRLRDKVLAQARQPRLYARRLDLIESHPVHPRRARILASQRIGVGKYVLATDLVVKQIEAEGRLRLRLAVELSLKAPDLLGRFETHRQSPHPRRLRKHAGSQGPSLPRSYPASTVLRPCPPPARSAAKSGVEAATSDRTGLPRLPALPFQRAVPITPTDRTGAPVDPFPARAAFP